MKTKIEWTEATWNPTVGCNKITNGCKNCYAEVMAHRLQAMGVHGYENGFEFTIMPDRLEQPYKIKKPTKFFVNSMSDLFHEKISYAYLDSIFEVMKNTPRHTYQVLTKREKIMADYLKDKKIPHNIWLGVTVEDVSTKGRIDYLRDIQADIKFISMEPLLEDLGKLDLTNIHWVIVGGESGAKARPMEEDWALNIKKQCSQQNIAFFFKQWGTWGSDGVRRNKKNNGRKLNGKIYDEYPQIEFSLG
ncbi:MAG: phage Gp37/Gp68 family protein [Candidatus Delongbacteria bacterium]|jgi:protein gp37|nr:phage Gp37/Gp68 family protein [Candidatus Delongbacteria bacterium]